MSANKTRIGILGHSHVRRLNEFVLPKYVNFGLDETKHTVKCLGVGGLKIRQLIDPNVKHNDKVHTFLATFQPQILMFCIGDNDIKQDSSAEEIINYLHATVTLLKSRFPCIEKIILCQLLPRHVKVGLSNSKNNAQTNITNSYNVLACTINNEMLKLAERCDQIIYLNCEFIFPSENPDKFLGMKRFYLDDGIHLNPPGYYQLFRQIKRALIKVIKPL